MKDCIGQDVKAGDTIVYFTRRSCYMESHKAKVVIIPDTCSWDSRPCILVLREDAVQKAMFTRKAWLWSLKSAVRISSPDRDYAIKAINAFAAGVEHEITDSRLQNLQ